MLIRDLKAIRIASSAVCEPAVLGNNQSFSQSNLFKSLYYHFFKSVGNRRMATVTISHPLLSILSIASVGVLYLPVLALIEN
jgi:hypothetical protein